MLPTTTYLHFFSDATYFHSFPFGGRPRGRMLGASDACDDGARGLVLLADLPWVAFNAMCAFFKLLYSAPSGDSQKYRFPPVSCLTVTVQPFASSSAFFWSASTPLPPLVAAVRDDEPPPPAPPPARSVVLRRRGLCCRVFRCCGFPALARHVLPACLSRHLCAWRHPLQILPILFACKRDAAFLPRLDASRCDFCRFGEGGWESESLSVSVSPPFPFE